MGGGGGAEKITENAVAKRIRDRSNTPQFKSFYVNGFPQERILAKKTDEGVGGGGGGWRGGGRGREETTKTKARTR